MIQREEMFYSEETPIRSSMLLEEQPLQTILDSGSSFNSINQGIYEKDSSLRTPLSFTMKTLPSEKAFQDLATTKEKQLSKYK